MGKRVLLFGPPGAGKGTHARRLAADLGVPHIATGDMFRQAMAHGTPLGQRVAAHMNAGELVPDDVVVALVRERLADEDARDGYLLDGFPRTLAQAEELSRQMATAGRAIDGVIALDAPEPVLMERLMGRATCSSCGASFHLALRPPKVAGVCDDCGGALVQRADDNEQIVRARLRAYVARTSPVLAFLRGQSTPVNDIQAVGEVSEVYARIRAAVGGAG